MKLRQQREKQRADALLRRAKIVAGIGKGYGARPAGICRLGRRRGAVPVFKSHLGPGRSFRIDGR
jgi:hypothetical protein